MISDHRKSSRRRSGQKFQKHSKSGEHLGELYAATGRKDDARSMFAAALEHATEAEQRKRLSGRLKQLK
jgi:predicted negative regulator of RcsB-dependent stress response